jgi:hypothetical protein
MKKWVFVVAGVLLVAVVLIDVLIPSTLTVSRVEPLQCRAVAAWPLVSEEARWKDWWPDAGVRRDFHIQRLSYYVVHIGIHDQGGDLNSQLSLLPVGIQDSALLHWEASLSCGWSPLNRLQQYGRARRLMNTMDEVLASARDYMSKKENLYGTKIDEVSTIDTMLISTRTEMAGMPADSDIYLQIERLQRHLREVNIKQTGYPMVNITPV